MSAFWLVLALSAASAQDEAPGPYEDPGTEAPVPEDEAPAPEPTGQVSVPEDELQEQSAAAMRREAADRRRLARVEKVFIQRSLSNHPFIQPQFVQSSLPTSHLGGGFGAGVVLDLTGNTAATAAIAGGVDVGVRFVKWIGLQAELNGIAGVSAGAAGEDGIPPIGAFASWDVSGGVPIRVVHLRSLAFTLKPAGHYQDITDVDVSAGLRTVRDQVQAGQDVDLAEAGRSMLSGGRLYGGGLHLALAYSPAAVFGMQVSVGGGAEEIQLTQLEGEVVDIRGAQGTVEAGLALSLDANPVPFAAMLEYGIGMGVGIGELRGNVGVEHRAGLGLYLNGLTNTVGLEVGGVYDGETIVANARLAFRAYF